MKIINAGYEILTLINGSDVLKTIELVARCCYKSEDKITDESSHKFVEKLIKLGHEAMIEHYNFSVKFTCDRGVSHEIVRHRIASFAQESTRYCNYSKDKFGKEITVIEPLFWEKNSYEYLTWEAMCQCAERTYIELIEAGATPQEVRSVLPNSLKTEIVMTANLREWRHFFKLRTAQAANPQIRELAIPLLAELKEQLPIIFDDIEPLK